MVWTEYRYCRMRLTFDSRWTCDGKNSPEFEHTATVMHGELIVDA
jgi:hypothetical protein